MPWKQLVKDPELQKQAIEYLFKFATAMLPLINAWRITRNTRHLRRHRHASSSRKQ